MTKNIAQKLVSIMLGLSLVLAGVSYVSTFAQAKTNGDYGDYGDYGLNINANGNQENISLKIPGMFGDSVKAAKATFQAAVKDANMAYKNAVKMAQDKLAAALKTATDESSRIAALRAYLTDVQTALRIKAAAIGTAFQAFIDAKFDLAPTANSQNVTVKENTSANITLTGTDPESSPLTFMVVKNPMHGTLSGTAPNLTYTPNPNFTGTDKLTFRVNDGSLNSTKATVSITVNP